MMGRAKWWLLVVVTGSFAYTTTARAAEKALPWVAHNDVVYESPARQAWEGLPLGNGTLGAQAWNPDALTFQLNTPWSGALGFSIARLRLLTAPGLLNDAVRYRQRLSLLTATLETDIDTSTGPIRITSWIAAGADVLVIEVDDRRKGDISEMVSLETWRPTATHAPLADGVLVTDNPTRGPVNAYPFAFAVGAAGGTKVQTECASGGLSRLTVAAKSYTIVGAFAGSRDPQADVAGQARALLDRCRKQGTAALRAEHEAWWAAFWARSYIQLSGPDGMPDYLANLWAMHVYAMASGSRGDLPPKFNGGLWTTEKDEREWGPAYWHWNTQETYWPLYAANHLDLIEPYYQMYFKMLPKVMQQTTNYFGVGGAHYGETIGWDGSDATGKGPSTAGLHPRLRLPAKGGHTSGIYSSSAEIAMLFWWRYLYTGDSAFLREKAYPLMRAVADFFVAFLEKDASGRYNMFPSNAHESFWVVKNPATDLAALRYLFPTVIKASEILGVDEELRPVWQDRLAHLAPWPIDSNTQGIAQFEVRPEDKVVWNNAENPNVFPMGVFPVIRLGSPEYDLGVRTFRTRKNVNVYGWTTDSIAAARLGLREDMEALLPGHVEHYQDHPSGLMDYYDRKPATHPYLEGSGTFATGLGEMLLQSWPATAGETNPVIRVCPALPAAWDARFKLLAMGGFEVECVAEKGRPTSVAITSTRGGAARVVNPFEGAAVVTDRGRDVLTSVDPILVFPTESGRIYVLTPAGQKAQTLGPQKRPENAAPKQLLPGSRRWLGKQANALARWTPPAEANAPRPPASPATVDRAVNPEVKPVRFAAPPVVDGALTDACWKAVAPLGPFILLGGNTGAVEQTDVRIGYDTTNLYVGITCWESQMDRLVAEYEGHPNNRDDAIFMDDSVELFVQPDSRPYWHLAVNVLGAVYDARVEGRDAYRTEFNPEWRVKTVRQSNRWMVEAAIPFHSLSPVAPAAGTNWGFNVCRNERPRRETSSWAPLTRAGFHTPGRFGRLAFAQDVEARALPLNLPGLIGCWSGASLAGQWVGDRSGRGHDAYAFGPVQAAPGRRGPAIALAGGYLIVEHAEELNLGDAFTLALWLNPKSAASMRLIDKGTAGGSDAYNLDTQLKNNIRFISRAFSFGRTETLPEGEWSHLAVTLGGNTARLYLNGKLLEERAGVQSTPLPNTLPLRIGADSNGGSLFRGLLEDVMMWRRALSAEEVAALGDEKNPHSLK
jgi:hypothetical protein